LSEEVKNRNWNDEDKFVDYANFDFSDELEKKLREETENRLFNVKVEELLVLMDTEKGAEYFKKEKDP